MIDTRLHLQSAERHDQGTRSFVGEEIQVVNRTCWVHRGCLAARGLRMTMLGVKSPGSVASASWDEPHEKVVIGSLEMSVKKSECSQSTALHQHRRFLLELVSQTANTPPMASATQDLQNLGETIDGSQTICRS